MPYSSQMHPGPPAMCQDECKGQRGRGAFEWSCKSPRPTGRHRSANYETPLRLVTTDSH